MLMSDVRRECLKKGVSQVHSPTKQEHNHSSCGHACQPAGTKRLLLAVPDSSVWVSQLGTKDKMIDRLVEKEKPPGGCAPHTPPNHGPIWPWFMSPSCPWRRPVQECVLRVLPFRRNDQTSLGAQTH